MKKAAVVVLAIALLTMTFAAVPVMAAPKATSPAWHTVSASLASNQPVTYEELTEACLSWGLPGNPYPAPSTETEVPDPPYVYVNNAASYYIFTQKIGDDIYEGVSCNVIEMVIYLPTMDIDYHSEAIWYLGDWGKKNAKMNDGFVGVVDLDLYNYGLDGAYYTGTFNLEGFGRFNHRTLMMEIDSRLAPLPAGYCISLGNRDKM